MHARLLRAPSSSASAAAASSSSFPSAGGSPRRASWNPRLAAGTTAPTQQPLSLRAPPPCSRQRPTGEGGPPVHGVTNTVVGVLGGGQLQKMLCQSASQMGIKTIILDPLVGCPASVCSEALLGASTTVTRSRANSCDTIRIGPTVCEFAKS